MCQGIVDHVRDSFQHSFDDADSSGNITNIKKVSQKIDLFCIIE